MKNKEIEELLNYIDQFVYVDQTYNDIKLSKIDCKLILSYIEQLENNRDKAIKFGNGLLIGEATFEERHIASRFLNILKGEIDD